MTAVTATGRGADRKLKAVTVADAATSELRQRILAGEYADGTPLRQDALANELGTSRIPVREALSRLQSEGLVIGSPHRGYVVKALSRDEIKELFDLRGLLEPDLIRHSIPQMKSLDFDYLELLIRKYSEGHDPNDARYWGELNVQYHMTLYAPSLRNRTLEIVRGLLINTDRYTRLVLAPGKGPDEAEEDHARLLEYCRKGSVNQAVALTRDHIERASDALLGMLESRHG